MTPEEIIAQFRIVQNELEELRYLLAKKIGGGSADIKGNVVNPSSVAGTIANNAVAQAQLKYEAVNVSISAGNPSGTAGVTSGSIVIGWYATGNQDVFIDNISVSDTTLTITLAANAVATNQFTVILLKV